MFEVKAKIWLELDSKGVIGEGRAELLHKIKELGSLSEVAKQMGMAYSHAWSEIKEISDVVGCPIITAKRGGKDGGRSVLTEEGEEVLKRFDEEKKNMNRYLAKRNKE